MAELTRLFQNNKKWAAEQAAADPQYFERLAAQQSPRFLWIGCSDSRVPANKILGLEPGEVFVHRNVANLVVHTDISCLSVLQFGIEVLKIENVIVCGHYGCGGVHAACGNQQFGLIDNWLRNIKDVYSRYRHELNGIADDFKRGERLCELNVMRQVRNVGSDVFVQDAWARGQQVCVHGWVYSLSTGLVNDLGVTIGGPEDLAELD